MVFIGGGFLYFREVVFFDENRESWVLSHALYPETTEKNGTNTIDKSNYYRDHWRHRVAINGNKCLTRPSIFKGRCASIEDGDVM